MGVAKSRPGEIYRAFVGRMVAYQRLWLITLVLQGDLGEVWRWLARTLNQKELRPISAALLFAALEVAGSAAHERYKTQFVKLAAYAQKHSVPQLTELTKRSAGNEGDVLACVQLKRWLDEFMASGRARAAKGRDVSVT